MSEKVSVSDWDRHPGWHCLRFLGSLATVVFIFWITASNFDADELIQVLYYAGAVGGGGVASRTVLPRLVKRYLKG